MGQAILTIAREYVFPEFGDQFVLTLKSCEARGFPDTGLPRAIQSRVGSTSLAFSLCLANNYLLQGRLWYHININPKIPERPCLKLGYTVAGCHRASGTSIPQVRNRYVFP